MKIFKCKQGNHSNSKSTYLLLISDEGKRWKREESSKEPKNFQKEEKSNLCL